MITWALVVALFAALSISLAIISPTLSIVATAAAVAAVAVRYRHRSLHPDSHRTQATLDWTILLVPIVLASRTINPYVPVFLLSMFILLTFIRKPHRNFRFQPGPLLVLILSAVLVFSRPEYMSHVTLLITMGILAFQLARTSEASVTVSSLVDGIGIYLLANVIGHLLGLRSPGEEARIGGLIEKTGFVRTLYPFSWSLDVPPTLASVYMAATIFLIYERGRVRRVFRIVCLAAALTILVGASARTSLAIAVVLPLVIICFPFVTRGVAQFATVLASASALVLPKLVSYIQFALEPFLSFISPGRDMRATNIASLNNREHIWENSIDYWIHSLNGFQEQLLGFGQNGQYRSGASLSYANQLAGVSRNPELGTVHNSFLQQLFDGGVLGWGLLTLALLWASIRLSKLIGAIGNYAIAAISALVVLLVNATTTVSIAPGGGQECFWILLILVAVACQSTSSEQAKGVVPGNGETLGRPLVSRRISVAKRGGKTAIGTG